MHEVDTVGAERITDHPGDLHGCGHNVLGVLGRDVP
jgi:alpha-tubulin suppressor-like RCC1 family protein